MSQEKMQPEPIKEYYIAYFDLLGYKEFFRSHPENVQDFLRTIHDAISNSKYYIHEANTSRIGADLGMLSIQTKVFSDNVLLCMERTAAEIEYPRLLAFLAIVADIQRNFILEYGLFLRGGITIGELSFNDDFVFGQGLIDAVELEETAIYPRIVMGKAVLDYVLQPHFVSQSDLDKACAIENRAHSGEHISDEELAFCNSIMPAVNMENFYLQWRRHLLLLVADNIVVLNYLYHFPINELLDNTVIEQMLEFLKSFSPKDYQKWIAYKPNEKQRFEVHKARIIQKIKEFGTYDDLDISDGKKAALREHIQKKYLWVMSFHNYVCTLYAFPEYMIKSGSILDLKFMRITTTIFDDNPPVAKSTTEARQQTIIPAFAEEIDDTNTL